MQPEEHTVTHTINRYRSFRYLKKKRLCVL